MSYPDPSVSARGREKKRARSKSRSPSRNKDERYASIRRRSHSPKHRSKVEQRSHTFKDDLWKHKRRTTDSAHYQTHKHRTSHHSIRSSRSPSRRRDPSTTEDYRDPFTHASASGTDARESVRGPPAGPRAFREQDASSSTSIAAPVSSSNAIPIPAEALAARQAKSVPAPSQSLVPSAKMFAPPQPPITPSTPQPAVDIVTALADTVSSGTLPNPQTAITSVPISIPVSAPVAAAPTLPSLQEIDNILTTLRTQNVLPSVPTPPPLSSMLELASTPVPEKVPISFALPPAPVIVPRHIPIPSGFESAQALTASSKTVMSSDQPALTSSDEVPKMEDDLDPDMKEEAAMSPRPLSPAPEPWSPASQPTDERKTWAQRIE